MSKEKERLRKLIEQRKEEMEKDPEQEIPDPGVDYAELYKEQTGRDLPPVNTCSRGDLNNLYHQGGFQQWKH